MLRRAEPACPHAGLPGRGRPGSVPGSVAVGAGTPSAMGEGPQDTCLFGRRRPLGHWSVACYTEVESCDINPLQHRGKARQGVALGNHVHLRGSVRPGKTGAACSRERVVRIVQPPGRQEVSAKMVQKESDRPESKEGKLVEGVLELCGRGDGFLRDLKSHLVPRRDDPLVRVDEIRKLGLRGGELLAGPVGAAGKGPGRHRLGRIEVINSIAVKDWLPPRRCTRPPRSTRWKHCSSTPRAAR